jgi:hypothetical protein
MSIESTTKRNSTLEAIAGRRLGIGTLATRNSDSLDFHDLHVANIRQALQDAYQAGAEAAASRLLERATSR